MANRKGPRDGYDVGRKRQYRREVWATFRKVCPVPMADARVFILPSIEGDEIEVAKQYGVRERNISICDSVPAIVATLKRRFPRVQTYGVDASEALWHRATDGYHLINLDLCGTLVSAMAPAALGAARLNFGGAIAVTWIKGRDNLTLRLMAAGGDVQRRWIMNSAVDVAHRLIGFQAGRKCPRNTLLQLPPETIDTFGLRCIRGDVYRIARVPMQWALYRSIPVGSPDGCGGVVAPLTDRDKNLDFLWSVTRDDFAARLREHLDERGIIAAPGATRERTRGGDGADVCLCDTCRARRSWRDSTKVFITA